MRFILELGAWSLELRAKSFDSLWEFPHKNVYPTILGKILTQLRQKFGKNLISLFLEFKSHPILLDLTFLD